MSDFYLYRSFSGVAIISLYAITTIGIIGWMSDGLSGKTDKAITKADISHIKTVRAKSQSRSFRQGQSETYTLKAGSCVVIARAENIRITYGGSGPKNPTLPSERHIQTNKFYVFGKDQTGHFSATGYPVSDKHCRNATFVSPGWVKYIDRSKPVPIRRKLATTRIPVRPATKISTRTLHTSYFLPIERIRFSHRECIWIENLQKLQRAGAVFELYRNDRDPLVDTVKPNFHYFVSRVDINSRKREMYVEVKSANVDSDVCKERGMFFKIGRNWDGYWLKPSGTQRIQPATQYRNLAADRPKKIQKGTGGLY